MLLFFEVDTDDRNAKDVCTKIELPYDPAILILGMYLDKTII